VINVYLVRDVLIDAGRTWDTARIRRQTAGRDLSMLALTHVHPDHQGAVQAICAERGIPLACHEADVDAMEGRRPVQEAAPGDIRNRLIHRFWEGPPRKVDRPFAEGDEIAGFEVIHAPGHQRGEVIFWRESDRVAICGDVVRNMSYWTTLAGVREPPEVFTYDVSENRRSIRKLAGLRPVITLPGHGPEIRGHAEIEALADRVGA
jgi:glyoxylase-like metal-dependent hydrolase (beta-lactamase superfamily II)